MASESYLTPVAPKDMTPEQKQFYDEIDQECQDLFGDAFMSKESDGTLIGPFGIYLHNKQVGAPFMDLCRQLGKLGLPPKAREVAILTTGAQYQADYELYAHSNVAVKSGLSKEQVHAIRDSKRPDDLDEDESIAYDVAEHLVSKKGALPKDLWEKAKNKFGEKAAFGLINYIGFYAWTCIILNGFNAVVPKEAEWA